MVCDIFECLYFECVATFMVQQQHSTYICVFFLRISHLRCLVYEGIWIGCEYG